MMAPLASESLDLDPANPSSLDVITATRAGTATYTDASGNIQTASPNTVRVDHVDGVPMILVEPAATNLVSYTDFSSGWVQGGLTISDGEGLNGEVSKVVENDDAGSGNTFYFNVPTVEGQTYTGGFWIRRISGSGSIALHHTFSPTSSQVMITNDVTSEWAFVSTQFLGRTGGGLVRFGVRVYYTSGDSVEIAMPQVEAGTVATSYIPTSGSAVTRAADDLVIDGSDFTNFYNQSEGTVYVEYEPRVLGTTNTALEFSDGSTNNRIFSLAASAYHCYIVDGGVNQAVLDGGTNTAGVLNRLAFSYEANNIQASLDGGAVVNDTSASIPTVDRLTLGRQTVGWPRHLNGRIKRLIYWPHHSDNL
ncbi:hypothetical protein OAL22_00650 [bacterium]|nr:hypothetical protein [bacterium]